MHLKIEMPDNMEDFLKKKKRYLAVKRVLDITFSLFALLLLSWLFLATAIAIKLDSKGKIIFKQLRTGKNGIPFVMYKFRSMYDGAEAKRKDLMDQNEMDGPVFKISNDPRVTRVGRFIRKYSIDELPQLINVLRGEMSIVGPRPLAVYETKEFTDYENIRHLVKPGLTCYWQVGGRSKLSFQEWIYLDMKYIKKMSFKTDCKLVIKTILVVALKKGAY